MIDQPVIAGGKMDALVFNGCCIYSACEQKAKEEEETHCVLLNINLIHSVLFSFSLPFKVFLANNASSLSSIHLVKLTRHCSVRTIKNQLCRDETQRMAVLDKDFQGELSLSLLHNSSQK